RVSCTAMTPFESSMGTLLGNLYEASLDLLRGAPGRHPEMVAIASTVIDYQHENIMSVDLIGLVSRVQRILATGDDEASYLHQYVLETSGWLESLKTVCSAVCI